MTNRTEEAGENNRGRGSERSAKTALLSPPNFRKKKKASCVSKKPIPKSYLFDTDTESR
jgi:hypothetical protein